MNMPRLTSAIFTDLLIYMVVFGLLMGLAFPTMMTWLGFEAESVYTLKFFMASMFAGVVMGAINFFLGECDGSSPSAIIGRSDERD